MTKSEKTRRFIIEQSAVIFNKKGIAGTSITDLMEATKLAKGGIYGNFNSKDEICVEVFDYLTGIVSSGLDRATAGKATAREKLFGILDYYHDNLAPNEMGGCPLLNFGTEADDTNPDLRQRVAKMIRKSQQRIARAIEEGQAAGAHQATPPSRGCSYRMAVGSRAKARPAMIAEVEYLPRDFARQRREPDLALGGR